MNIFKAHKPKLTRVAGQKMKQHNDFGRKIQ